MCEHSWVNCCTYIHFYESASRPTKQRSACSVFIWDECKSFWYLDNLRQCTDMLSIIDLEMFLHQVTADTPR